MSKRVIHFIKFFLIYIYIFIYRKLFFNPQSPIVISFNLFIKNNLKYILNLYIFNNYIINLINMSAQVDAENIETFKKEQQEFEAFVKEIEQKKKEFDIKKEEIMKTNEEIKNKLEKIKKRSEEIKAQTGEIDKNDGQ